MVEVHKEKSESPFGDIFRQSFQKLSEFDAVLTSTARPSRSPSAPSFFDSEDNEGKAAICIQNSSLSHFLSPSSKKATTRPLTKTTYQPAIKQFFCATCGTGFTRQSSLNKHVKNIHTMPQMKYCPYRNCSFITRNSAALISHKKTHSSGKQLYFCRACQQRFSDRSALLQHLSRNHRSDPTLFGHNNAEQTDAEPDEDVDISEPNIVIPLDEPICVAKSKGQNLSPNRPKTRKQVFIEQVEDRELQQKENTTAEPAKPTYDCDRCKFSAKSYRSLLTHRRVAHKATKDSYSVAPRYYCHQCHRMFTSAQKMAQHVRQAHISALKTPPKKRNSASLEEKPFSSRSPSTSTNNFDQSQADQYNMIDCLNSLQTANASLIKLTTNQSRKLTSIRQNVRSLLAYLQRNWKFKSPTLRRANLENMNVETIDTLLNTIVNNLS